MPENRKLHGGHSLLILAPERNASSGTERMNGGKRDSGDKA